MCGVCCVCIVYVCCRCVVCGVSMRVWRDSVVCVVFMCMLCMHAVCVCVVFLNCA